MEFGCCSRFRKCSEEGFCITDISELRNNCLYRKRLKQGYNFYSEEHKKNKFYLVINNRQFYIGKRSSYGSYTYSLDYNQKQELLKQLDEINIYHTEKQVFNRCKVEKTTETDRAYCIVVITIDGIKYNVQNFNIRAIKKSTASEIKRYFINKGIAAYIERIGKKAASIKKYKMKKVGTSKNTKEDSKRKEENLSQDIFKEQISIFDLKNINFQHTTDMRHLN
ncbi:hypothetical protein [Sporosalibacterium faouarense]|uniref:hypothetical protein n=1 Tax=Sporosalibacterium faouarense TaxID=516123 RepID=UPI00192C93A8|nr:hypothetical protein [Sporosalibacterium faouarense]